MRRFLLNGSESLELKLYLTSMSAVGAIAAPAVFAMAPKARTDDNYDDRDDYNGDDGDGSADNDDDRLPDTGPPPRIDRGDNPIIVYPVLPPSGPSGPG